MNNLTANFSELLANIFSGMLFNGLGIKKVMLISWILAALGMLLLIITKTQDQLQLIIFILTGKFGIASAFNTAFMGNSVLFPVSILATSYGICQTFCRFFTILSPFVGELKPEVISEYIFVTVSVFAMIASACLRKKRYEENVN